MLIHVERGLDDYQVVDAVRVEKKQDPKVGEHWLLTTDDWNYYMVEEPEAQVLYGDPTIIAKEMHDV